MQPNALMILFALVVPAVQAAADTGTPVILAPAPGAVVTSPVTVTIQPPAMPAGMSGMKQHGDHLHLIIDAPLPAPGTMVPMDAQHVHLMHGETTKTLTLAPGKHTIQLVEGSMGHKIAEDAPHSDPVTFEVK